MDIKKKEKKQLNKANYQLLWRFMDGSKHLFLLSIAASALVSLADMVTPQIISIAVDNCIMGLEPKLPAWAVNLAERFGGFAYLGEHLWILAVALVVIALFRCIAQYFTGVFNNKASETLVKTMRDGLFSHIERLPFSWHMKNHTGDIIQRCTSDVDKVRAFVSEQLTNVIRIVVLIVFSLFFMFRMHVGLTLIAVALVPVTLAFALTFGKKMHKGFEVCDETEGKVSAMVQENLTGVRVVRAFAKERYERDRFQKKNEEYCQLWVDMGTTLATYFSTQDIISLSQVLLVLIFGCIFCVQGKLTAGNLLAFISYNGTLSWPIRRLGRMLVEMSKADVSIGRIAYIMNSPAEKDDPKALEPPIDKEIVFDHINFAYENCPEILHDVSFTIEPGTTLGILGGTGSGKSTLMLLLDKMYDLPEGSGSITIGGVDIREIRTEYLRNNISMVLQEPFLFSRSISENIGITDSKITLESIREAAKAACLDDSVTGFPKGYDTFVGERGVTLSGGQKQRAAIARALTKSAPIMIFDDSLSAVDTETDAKIRDALASRFGSATTILISHRLTTLSKADKVIVLDNGRLVEMGTPAELKTAGGIYQKIYEIQSGISGKEAANE